MPRRLSEMPEPSGRHWRLPVLILPKRGYSPIGVHLPWNGRLRSHTQRPYRVRTRAEVTARATKRQIADAAAANHLVGRPQHPDLSSIAYCCKIITLGELSVFTMQAALVEVMTMQLVALYRFPPERSLCRGQLYPHRTLRSRWVGHS